MTVNLIFVFVGIVKRKVLVLDLDETLIHSFHDGVVRQTVKPGTPPDFVLKVVIDRHPVRFFVHKRPHVDFFLDIVSKAFVVDLIPLSSPRFHLYVYIFFFILAIGEKFWYRFTFCSFFFHHCK